MPILPQKEAAYIVVIAGILIGIIFEKKVGLENIASNIVSFIAIISTTDMAMIIIMGMLFYLVLGIIILKYKIKKLYFFFGCKTYNAFALVFLFANDNYFGLSLNDYYGIFIGVILLSIFIHLIAYLWWRK